MTFNETPWIAAIFIVGVIGNAYLTWWRGNSNAEDIKALKDDVDAIRLWKERISERLEHKSHREGDE